MMRLGCPASRSSLTASCILLNGIISSSLGFHYLLGARKSIQLLFYLHINLSNMNCPLKLGSLITWKIRAPDDLRCQWRKVHLDIGCILMADDERRSAWIPGRAISTGKNPSGVQVWFTEVRGMTR
jgi:hypothetical protein